MFHAPRWGEALPQIDTASARQGAHAERRASTTSFPLDNPGADRHDPLAIAGAVEVIAGRNGQGACSYPMWSTKTKGSCESEARLGFQLRSKLPLVVELDGAFQ